MQWVLSSANKNVLMHATEGMSLENVLGERSLKRPHGVWFHLREMSRASESINSMLAVAEGGAGQAAE